MYMIETKIYCYKGTTFRSHISGAVMKLLIILTFCLGFVVCRDTLTFILPAETGPAPVHKGAFCQFPFPQIYYRHSIKSTGKETGKTHLCAVPASYQPVPAVIPPSDEIPGIFKVWFVYLGPFVPCTCLYNIHQSNFKISLSIFWKRSDQFSK